MSAVERGADAAPAPADTGFARSTAGLRAGVVGNSRIGALVDERGAVSWMCVPRFDGDPVFCSLLDDDSGDGRFAIENCSRRSNTSATRHG